ncbi:MAG: cation:proton antiporter [Haloferacaceae archaeon]
MATGIEAELIDLLAIFLIAGGVGVFIAKVGRVPYTIALLLAGIAASLAGLNIGIELTHDVILLVILPPLLFEGAATTDLEEFRSNLPVILLLATVGLLLSVLVLAAAAYELFQFPLLVALLFGVIVLPTDPVSVLAIFKQVGAPERLAVLLEGESLLNDGVAVVLFSALIALVGTGGTGGGSAEQLATLGGLADLAGGILLAGLGGAAVGFAAGYLVYRVMVNLDEHMTEIVLTVILAYGSFLVAEHYLHVSGVIATVVAGLWMGNRGREHAMSPQTKTAVFTTWETAAFVVNTFIFVLLGVQTPVPQIVDNAGLLAPAIVLVLVARAVAVYPLTWLSNRVTVSKVPRNYQHVLLWGGLHGSIPIALVLGLPPATPLREQLRVLVFGIAAFSLVVQGLSIRRLLEALDIRTTSEAEQLYALLLSRARAVDEALEEAERLHDRNVVRTDVYERFHREYGHEKAELNATIRSLLVSEPSLRQRELLAGERRVLKAEESAIVEAELEGQIPTHVANRLLGEVRLKQELVEQGQTTVTSDVEREGFEEFWRQRVREFGLTVEAPDDVDRELVTGSREEADAGDDGERGDESEVPGTDG